MSKRANRVGLANNQVDVYGRIKLAKKQLTQIIASLPRWTDFNVFKNGTEQILPVNTSVPSTSPIIADIDYPNGRRNNQSFLYRESPTKKDGRAWIRNIKGNTVSFNQLVGNGNFANNNGWTTYGSSVLSVFNNVGSVSLDSSGSRASVGLQRILASFTTGHKMYFHAEIKASREMQTVAREVNSVSVTKVLSPNTWTLFSDVGLKSADSSRIDIFNDSAFDDSLTFDIRNVMLMDLTLIGIDNFTTAVEVEAWLSSHVGDLPYYAYTLGTLIPFNGTELKTTGKNLFDGQLELGGIEVTNGSSVTASDRIRTSNYIKVKPNTTYIFKDYPTSALTYTNIIGYKGNFANINDGAFRPGWSATIIGTTVSGTTEISFTTTPQTQYIKITILGTTDILLKAQVEIGSIPSTYEPYISNILSLPTLTYFPTGMKSAGSVYDEIDPETNKVYTRVGSVDLGSLDWTYKTSGSAFAPFFYANFPNQIKYRGVPNNTVYDIVTSIYKTIKRSDGAEDKTVCVDGTSEQINIIQIKDTSYTDATTFKTAMSGVMFYYELETPTEEPIIELD